MSSRNDRTAVSLGQVSWFGWDGCFLVPAMNISGEGGPSGSRIAKGDRHRRRAACLNRTASPRHHDMARDARLIGMKASREVGKFIADDEKRVDLGHSRSVERTFGVNHTPHAMAKVLKRLGFVYKMPKCVPAKANEEARRKFVEETLGPLMKAANDDTPLYFVDGTHPSYTGHPSHGWIRKGQTRELKSNHGRVNVNINGALRWPDRTVVYREAEKITSAEMIRLFEDLQALHPTSTAIWVVLDNARYNHSKELKDWLSGEGSRIRLVYAKRPIL
jgi:hypothetical protein